MGWRSELEDKYTVKCKHCGYEIIDPQKKPRQKYIKGVCPQCQYDSTKKRAR